MKHKPDELKQALNLIRLRRRLLSDDLAFQTASQNYHSASQLRDMDTGLLIAHRIIEGQIKRRKK